MRRRQWVAVLALLMLFVAAVAVFELTRPPAPPPVGAVLYLWYGGPGSISGIGTPGWNSSSSPGGGAVVDQPIIGCYVSDSNQTFKTQIDQMQSFGISFAVVSWWGPYAEGEAGAINNATQNLFRYLKGTDSRFKIAIMVDSFPETSNTSVTQVYSYAEDRFVTPFTSWYFKWQGKPLLLFFNPLQPGTNSNFTVRTIGNRPNAVDWIWWDAPSQYFADQWGSVNATNDEGPPVISPDGEVTIVPRIDGYFNRGHALGSYLRFDPNLSKGLYREQWGYVMNHSSSIKLVIVYSWNEYHERTEIEPHFDRTANVGPDYLGNLTARYVSELGCITPG